MVKLLHLSGLHLGGVLHVASEALLQRMRAAQRTALRRAVACALREEVAAVLVAGNGYDDALLDFETECFLVKQLARLDEAGIRCFWATGPRDAGGSHARGTDIAWPAGVHRFADAAPETVTLDSGGARVRIVGAGYDASAAASFPKATSKMPHVGLAYAPPGASVPPAEGSARSSSRSGARNAGYAYWALGGAPKASPVDGAGERAWHAGPLTGRSPDEAGPQGGLLVTLGGGGDAAPTVRFESFAPVQWADLQLGDLRAAETQHALVQQARRAFTDGTAADEQTAWFARFALTGPCPLAASLQERDAREQLEATLAEQLDLEAAFVRCQNLTPPADPAHHRGEPHVLGEALALIDRAKADAALRSTLAPDERAAALDDEAGDDDLRGHFEGLDREACARMLRADAAS